MMIYRATTTRTYFLAIRVLEGPAEELRGRDDVKAFYFGEGSFKANTPPILRAVEATT